MFQGIRGIGPKSSRTGVKPLPIKFVGLPLDGGDETKPRLKSPLLPLEDWWGDEKNSRDEAVAENRFKERLDSPSAFASTFYQRRIYQFPQTGTK